MPYGAGWSPQAGLTWGDLDHETQAFGLAVTGGLVSTTGISGFTLGGGVGWLLRRHGLASDNPTAAEVVTADGRVVRADPQQHSDLHWALRGGGNFGVVTSLEYQLHPVGPQALAGLIIYPLDEARQVVTGWREPSGRMPDELTTLVNLTTAPPLSFLPPEVHGTRLVVLAGMYAGDPAAGEAAVGPLRGLGTPPTSWVRCRTRACSHCWTRCGRPARTTTSRRRSSSRPTPRSTPCCGTT
ncbi:FAD-binding protein [Streptomyces sp. NPDC001093]|uniref:FAD-binding oxidoreductase n=1 Tax=Streptomyces sp. NPDC001093 TaxID=3154376 RepID=UPI003317EA56